MEPQNPLQQRRVIDLSQPLAEDLPTTWPGHMPYQHRLYNWYAPLEGFAGQKIFSASHYRTNYMIIDEHTGTHYDAPVHFIPPPDSGLPAAGPLGTMTGEQVPLEWLQGPAAVIDVTHITSEENGVSPWITDQHVKAWETENGALSAGDVVLLRAGWDRYYVPGPEGEKYMQRAVVHKSFPGWPAPSADLANYLASKGIHCLGMDVPSIGAVQDGVSAHQAGLGKGLLYVESLTNLDQLPTRGSFFIFLPVKIANSSGGPGRAIAYV
jgi:kynurenine formamidase